MIAGGVGGARMARGLTATVEPSCLTLIVNVGDDSEMYGSLVSADLDTVTYTLAGINGPQGWGIAGDTHVVMDHLAAAGIDTRFRLGDRDLAHCLARTLHLDGGGTLSEYTQAAATRLGIGCTVLPASNDPIRTKIHTESGETLDFQDYFVLRGHQDTVSGVEFRGIATAKPTPGAVAAVETSELVIIAPSNPPLSIWPTLAMPSLASAVGGRRFVVAVSPLIGGKAIKGPLVDVMRGVGLAPTNAGIVEAYEGVLSHLVIDAVDSAEAPQLEAMGVKVIVAETLIAEPAAAAALARAIFDHVLPEVGAP